MPISKHSFISLALDNLRSAYNVGSIFRTADAIGVNRLFLIGLTPLPLHPKVAKTALDSQHSVTWSHHCDTQSWAKWFKNHSVSLIALETEPGAPSLYTYTFPANACLLVGNEVNGITPELKPYLDQIVTIPQYGVKTSLNVAIATSMALFEYRRQYPHLSSPQSKPESLS